MMSAATAPAKRTAENVTVIDEGSQVQLIHMRASWIWTPRTA